MKSIKLAREAMQIIVQNVQKKTLDYTTYCAMVVKLQNGKRAVVVSEAGQTAKGIAGWLVDKLDVQIEVPIIPCAAPVEGEGTWHMNDAEQQALNTFASGGTFSGAKIKAVVASRTICESCKHTLTKLGLQVNGAEAVAP